MIQVKKLMTKNLLKISANATVKESADIMKNSKVGSILVSKENEIIGIITETDIIQKVVAGDLNPYVTKVENIMSFPLLTIDSEKTIIDANDLMDKKHVRHLGVTEEGELVGVISVRDLLHPIYLEKGESW